MPKPSILDQIPIATSAKSESAIATIGVAGDAVSRYAEASDTVKKAQEVMDSLAPELQEAGLAWVFAENAANKGVPTEMISSVNLVDENQQQLGDSADRVQFSWTRKMLKNDPKAVKAMFSTLTTRAGEPASCEQYCSWEVVGKFDTSVFMVKDSDGNPKFSEKRYKAFCDAIAEVAEQFKVPNPLSTSKVLVPKPDFHSRRFHDFGVAANKAIMAVMPNQMSLKAIRAEPNE